MPEALTPNCPLCGEPPVMVVSGTQAFCGNEDTCNLVCWDPSVSREENLRDAEVVRLPASKDGAEGQR